MQLVPLRREAVPAELQRARAMRRGGAVQVESSLTHGLKASGFNPCAYQVISWFQILLSNATCTATSWSRACASATPRGRAVQLESS
jgi:hypothetical protein